MLNKRNDSECMAAIVTYNPVVERLNLNILAIVGQVKKVLIIDNASENWQTIEKMLQSFDDKVEFIRNYKNLGIAKALNQACSEARESKINWTILLDQDSICPSNYMAECSKYMYYQDVAILAPLLIDKRQNKYILNYPTKSKIREVKKAITSGSIINIDIWNKLNGFDNFLFIDGVDFEYCYRVRQKGYVILLVESVVIDHELGETKTITFMGLKINYDTHSSMRYYYITRNIIYIEKKEKRKFWFVRIILREIKNYIYIILDKENRKENIEAFCSGIKGINNYDY